MTVSTLGGLLLVVSALLFVFILARAHRRAAQSLRRSRSASPAHPGVRTPVALNGFGLWVAMMIGLTVVNYGYPDRAARRC